MLHNYKERADYLKTHAHITLDAGNLIVTSVPINERLYYEKVYIMTSMAYPEPHEEYVCVHSYCADGSGYRVSYTNESLPASDVQAVYYLKDHRNDEFVKGLVL